MGFEGDAHSRAYARSGDIEAEAFLRSTPRIHGLSVARSAIDTPSYTLDDDGHGSL